MGRAAKVQSFFESAMTGFTEQLHIELLRIVAMFLITLWFSFIYKCLDVVQYFWCCFRTSYNYFDIFNNNIDRQNMVIYLNSWLHDCINSFINFVIR